MYIHNGMHIYCVYVYIHTCIYDNLKAPPLLPTFFFAYWVPSYMAFGTVPKGFEKYGGWGEAPLHIAH